MVTRIPFQGLKNTRDLGGKTGAGGRTLRPRMLLRGEALYKATPEDVRRLLNDYRLRRKPSRRPKRSRTRRSPG